MGKRIWLGIGLWACAWVAVAAGPAADRKQVARQAESSMVVTGTIDIEPDGSVSGHKLDQPEKLPAAVVKLIGSATTGWRFEPVVVAGKAVKARARMSVRLVARQVDKDNYSVELRNADFGDDAAEGERVSALKLVPPKYPLAAVQRGIHGVVYLVVRVGRQGTVEDAVAEQVNLEVVGTEREMTQGRELLAQAALRAVKKWTFKPPTSGADAAAAYWSIRVPVDFTFEERGDPTYGKWQTYVPGPRQTPSWAEDETGSPAGSDAMAAGGVYPVGKGPRLLTPLGGG